MSTSIIAIICGTCGAKWYINELGVHIRSCLCIYPGGTTTPPYSVPEFVEEEPTSSPAVCPVCQGRGRVPNGFYNNYNGIWTTTTISTNGEQCRSCNGTGVVWKPE